MILRVTFFALMALGLLGLGFIGYASTRPPQMTAAQTAAAKTVPVMIAVLAAAHDIPAGTLLKPTDLASKQVPRNSVPAGGTLDFPAAAWLWSAGNANPGERA